MPYAPANDLNMYHEVHGEGPPLIGLLGLESADVAGFSMGGGAALQLAIRHPALVRRLVVISAGFRYDAMLPEALALFPSITPRCSPAARGRRSTSAWRRIDRADWLRALILPFLDPPAA